MLGSESHRFSALQKTNTCSEKLSSFGSRVDVFMVTEISLSSFEVMVSLAGRSEFIV
ncbi:hypothetical protein M9194_02850 [Vibrio sp. S4M6]|nr:hypothetical protein [Vibrio sinus]MCL9780370.1 hypothetical protein [Vibrio sinus]